MSVDNGTITVTVSVNDLESLEMDGHGCADVVAVNDAPTLSRDD